MEKKNPFLRSTLYRWLERYTQNPVIEALLNTPKPLSKKKSIIESEWVDYALALLEEEPERSLFILGDRIVRKFILAKPPSKSSLNRALQKEPRYLAITRRRKSKGGRNSLRRDLLQKTHTRYRMAMP